MKQLLTENLGWKLLSVLVAFLLWVGVAREPEMSTSFTAPILFRNMPETTDFVSEVLERAQVEVRGPARLLTPESLAQTSVVFDLRSLEPGEHTFNIRDRNIRGLPIGVFFNRAIPSQVSLRLDHVIAKSVPIEPSYLHGPQEGYLVVGYTFDPPQVRIRGPASLLKNIDHVTTDPIDISGVVSQASIPARIRLVDPQARLEGSSAVQFVVSLQRM